MHCSAIMVKGIGVLEVCRYGNKIREVRVRVGADGVHEESNDDFADLIINYVNGLVDAREVLKYISLGPGLLGLAQLAMLSIPRGRVASYSQIAKLLNTSPRAIGRLASANKLPVIVPCHRVVRNDGSLGGYSFGSAEIKRALLAMEGVPVVNNRVPRQYFVDYATLMTNFRELLKSVSEDEII
ncbi:MAG: MGMT family protein [Vulcanisaeta sp.]|nr:MGMT family protein [Vulcanisaeta sp.]